MDLMKQLKKTKKLNRRGKLINKGEDDEVAEKNAVLSSLMLKCGKTRNEVLVAYEDFHLKYEEGVISNQDYIESTPKKVILI